jgi:Xaa-Pro aminopeptidase
MEARLRRLRAALQDAGLDGIIVSLDANRRYISGFSGSAGILVVTADRALLLSDFRYRERAKIEAPEWEFWLLRPPEASDVRLIARAVAELHIGVLGFEATHLSVAAYRTIEAVLREQTPTAELRATTGLIEELRTVKDAAELATLERAIAITDAAFATVRRLLRPSMSERDVAWELEKAIRQAGGDGLAFPTIVAAGAAGASPHAVPGEQQIGVGRPITIDVGARVDGYHADMTRTLILGETDEEFTHIYDVVLAANQTASAAIRPSMPAREAHALAHDVIAAAGFGDAFGHGLGHGVGLAIHEAPWLRDSNDAGLPEGAVFSIEPGIYLPGWGGVRIEDLVLLTPNGPRTLTQSSKDPLILLA